MWVLVCLLVLIGSVGRTQAATYYVATTGLDSRTTTQAQNPATPWQTIQKAATTAVAGDTVNVAAGTYQERVTFPNSGAAGQPITFIGAGPTSTIVDGGTSASGWEPASGFTTGVYEIAKTAYGFGGPVPGHATVNDKMFVFVTPNSSPDDRGIINIAAGSAQWDGMEAVCADYPTFTRCRFRDGADPDTKNLKLAPFRVGAFTIDNKSYLTVSGFGFKNAYHCARITNFAHHITYDNNRCTHGAYSVEISFGAHHVTLSNSQWFLDYIYANHGLPRYKQDNTVEPDSE